MTVPRLYKHQFSYYKLLLTNKVFRRLQPKFTTKPSFGVSRTTPRLYLSVSNLLRKGSLSPSPLQKESFFVLRVFRDTHITHWLFPGTFIHQLLVVGNFPLSLPK